MPAEHSQRPAPGRPFTAATTRPAQLRSLSTRRSNRIVDLIGRGPLAQGDRQRIIAAAASATDLDALLLAERVAS